MAKREFVDKNDALEAVEERIKELKADKEFNIVKEICISGVRKHILDASTITEQEIVKPYLEKLKEQIENKEHEVDFMNDWADGWNSCLNEILSVIDSLLSEQEN